MTTVAAAGVFAMLLSWAVTRVFLQYALSRGIVDVPNTRSSHSTPTPRGGGIAIVIAVLTALVTLVAAGVVPWRQLVAVGGGGLAIAGIGYADDHRSVSAGWRLTSHFGAAAWVVWWLGTGTVPVTDSVIHLGFAGDVLAVLFVVWMINLTNFMDGIDGIASVEAVSVAFGGCVLLALSMGPVDLWSTTVVLAGACLGFLVWNWPPAKIFMGDVGSGFLGFALAALALHAGQHSMTLFWGWVILLGVFVTDATLTLLRRILRGERIYHAHRSHAYQHAAIRVGSHRPVTLAVLAINLLWLAPIAVLTVTGTLAPLPAIVVAYAPLAVMAAYLGAGAPPVNPDEGRG